MTLKLIITLEITLLSSPGFAIFLFSFTLGCICTKDQLKVYIQGIFRSVLSCLPQPPPPSWHVQWLTPPTLVCGCFWLSFRLKWRGGRHQLFIFPESPFSWRAQACNSEGRCNNNDCHLCVCTSLIRNSWLTTIRTQSQYLGDRVFIAHFGCCKVCARCSRNNCMP